MKIEFTSKDIKEGKVEKTKRIGHVDYYMVNKTPYSFHFYAVLEEKAIKATFELLYDLRNREYYIKKNGKELKFNYRNLDRIIPREKDKYSYCSDEFHSVRGVGMFLDMVSVEENKGMYRDMLLVVGTVEAERVIMTSRALVRLITEYNKLELVQKAGYDIKGMNTRVFRNMIVDAGLNGYTKIHQIFNLTKYQLKFIKEFNLSPRAFINIVIDAKYLTQEDIAWFRSSKQLVEVLERKYHTDERAPKANRFLTLYDLTRGAERRERDLNYTRDGFFSLCLELNVTNTDRLLEYLLFECYFSQGMEFGEAMQYYRDYYNMCRDLEYARFEKYPKYLKTYHDIVARNYKEVLDEVENRQFIKATKGYKHMETTLNNYVVVVPDTPEQLVYEGNSLSHCVSSYIRKVREGKTQIMFLRDKKEQEKPLVTVEVFDGAIVQARGFSNRVTTPEERKALVTFAKKQDLGVKI